ncbi:unnamed protein product, partial [Didymodactylos carnosus]
NSCDDGIDSQLPVSESLLPPHPPQRELSNYCGHLVTDPNSCLNCIATMYGPQYAPFAAFMDIFNDFASEQKSLLAKHNHIMESYFQHRIDKDGKTDVMSEKELDSILKTGLFTNGEVRQQVISMQY